jgi:serine/threonine protein kinase
LKGFETIESDLWALGLVFLESMVLQSSFEIYYSSEEGSANINIDSNLLAQRIQRGCEMYSPLLMGLIDILLAPDPKDRSWNRIMEYNS